MYSNFEECSADINVWVRNWVIRSNPQFRPERALLPEQFFHGNLLRVLNTG